MHYTLAFASLAVLASAAKPFLNEPPTGYYEYFNGTVAPGTLPPLQDIVSLPDFDAAARGYMNASEYTYYRAGVGGEWSYRNNLDSFMRVPFRPRMLRNATRLRSTMPTTALGYNFSAPFFIAPAARAGYLHPNGEENYVQAAADTDILYVPSQYSSRTKEELYEARQRVADNSSSDAPVFFQQMYLNGNDIPGDVELMRSYADLGARGFIVTADAPADSSRQRADRYNVASANSDLTILTWDYLRELRVAFDLPVVAKGILSVEDVRIAIEEGHEAIYLSNHGGRQVDGTPSPFEVCQEIDAQDPSLFQQIDVWADGGVRYGSDVLKFLALGVKMVGVGRGLSYPNTYGIEGVTTAITMLKDELFQDAANLGVTDLKNVSASILNLNPVFPRYSFG